MGEVIGPLPARDMSRTARMRRAVSNFLAPPADLERYEAVDKIMETLFLRLQRANQQLNVLTSDVGQYKSTLWDNLVIGDYNPEEIGYEEYKKMLNYDAQVITGFDLIQMGILMKPWRISHSNDEIVDIVTKAFHRMRYPSFRDAMKEMVKAIAYGFSVTEIVFDTYKGYWMPRRTNGLKTLDPEKIEFFSDGYGNLLKVEEKIQGQRIQLPLDRTLIWTHEREWGNWYGKSILRGCFKNWFIKDAMLKFANIAYERFGSPILLGIAATNKDLKVIADAIQHLFARSQAVIRKADEKDPTDIKVIESKRTEMPFDRYIRYQDEMILRRMLIGQQMFEGGGSTYSSKVPLDLLMMRFEDFRLELTTMINTMLQVITDLNWPVDEYPKFSFAPLTTMDQAAIVQKIFDSIDRKVIYKDEQWVRDELNFPPASDEFKDRLKESAEEEPEEKEQELAAGLPGRFLAGQHAKWLTTGYKKAIVSTKPHDTYSRKEVYIVGPRGIYGTMIEGEPEGPFNADIKWKLFYEHRISADEWAEWWGGAKAFYLWRPRVTKRFESPLKYQPPLGVQDYIKNVNPGGEI